MKRIPEWLTLALQLGDRRPKVSEFFFVCRSEHLVGRLCGRASKWQRAISICYKYRDR